MRRFFAFLLAALLLCASAVSETRESVIQREGLEEPITETRYESKLGFSFWYDASVLTVDETMSEDGMSLILYPTDSDEAIYLEIMLPESVGVLPWKYLELNAPPETEYVYSTSETGAEVIWFRKTADFNEDFMEGFYVVQTDETFVAATTTCVREAEEGFGAYLRKVIWSISFAPESGVKAQWADEALEGFSAYDEVAIATAEEPARVLFSTDVRVRDFKVLELTFNGADGQAMFDVEEVYAQDELTAERPLVAELVFYGDIPNNGIAYTDEKGFTHRLAVEISGEDGSLLLTTLE